MKSLNIRSHVKNLVATGIYSARSFASASRRFHDLCFYFRGSHWVNTIYFIATFAAEPSSFDVQMVEKICLPNKFSQQIQMLLSRSFLKASAPVFTFAGHLPHEPHLNSFRFLTLLNLGRWCYGVEGQHSETSPETTTRFGSNDNSRKLSFPKNLGAKPLA